LASASASLSRLVLKKGLALALALESAWLSE
jgi:hypothetical protein